MCVLIERKFIRFRVKVGYAPLKASYTHMGEREVTTEHAFASPFVTPSLLTLLDDGKR